MSKQNGGYEELDRSNHNIKERTNHNIKDVLIIGFFSFLLVIGCFLVNLIQLIAYLTIRFINIDYYRHINCFMQYIIYSQMVAIAEWWSKSSAIIYFGDENSRKMFGREHSFGVCNHRYEVDSVFVWMALEKVGALGGVKAFGKSSLKFVPIFGWNFFFSEYIFLQRNWEKDSKLIGLGLDRLMAHKQNVSLMIAAEGTRFTPEKYETSMKFAQSKALGVHYKHHLLPRIKGFAYTVKYLKENYPNCGLYNIQVAFDLNKVSEVTASNIIRGLPMHGSIYIKRIPIDAVPTETEDQTKQFLYDLYTEKDEIQEYHNKNHRFPGIPEQHRASRLPLVILFTNCLIVGIPFFYLLFRVFTSGNTLLIFMTSLFIIAVYIALYFAIRSTKLTAASTYGTLEGNSNSNLNISTKVHTLVNGNSNKRHGNSRKED